MELHIIILAAGQGTRLHSTLPKVLHCVGGKPLLQHVIDTAKNLTAKTIHVIHGYGGDKLQQQINDPPVNWVHQAQQLGTGHAVLQALPGIPDHAQVLVLYGDTPLVSKNSLNHLLTENTDNQLSLLVTNLADPTGYGRIIRDKDNNITQIIEEKDATNSQRKVTEIWTGFLTCKAASLKQWLSNINNKNAQQEYYLPSIIPLAIADGYTIQATSTQLPGDIMGINNREQLAVAEREYQHTVAKQLMTRGVTLLDPHRFDCRGEIDAGIDVTIDINVILEGTIKIGNNTTIGANCHLKNVTLADNVTIKANTIIEDATIGSGCSVGPFARIRPGTVLKEDVRIGNFVEVKKSNIGEGSKIDHLSYIGDATLGSHVKIGAGTITCNYDGTHKHKTIIEDNVFIGSNTQLVAPVTIGKGATIGAGSTITKDAPAKQLTLARAKQKTIEGWQPTEK